MRPRLGCVLPQYADPGEIRAFAEAVEDIGYDYLTVPEHVVSTAPSYESLTLVGFLGAVTTRVELCAVTLLPLRSTVLAAKQAAQLDRLSGGRLRMVVVAGWNTAETAASGVDPSVRGDLVEEQVEAMRLLWTGDEVRYDGEHVTLPGVRLDPPPTGPIPLWMGGGTARTLGRPANGVLRRVARVADGFTMSAVLGTRVDRGAELVADLLAAVEQAGRDPAAFGVEARLVTGAAHADRWAGTARRWADAGATHLTVSSRVALAGVAAETSLLADVFDAVRTA